MSTPVPQPDPAWTATGQIDADIDATVPGGATPSQRVYFTLTDSGVTSSVLIPDTRIGDTAYVRSQIAAKARQLAAITALSSG